MARHRQCRRGSSHRQQLCNQPGVGNSGGRSGLPCSIQQFVDDVEAGFQLVKLIIAGALPCSAITCASRLCVASPRRIAPVMRALPFRCAAPAAATATTRLNPAADASHANLADAWLQFVGFFQEHIQQTVRRYHPAPQNAASAVDTPTSCSAAASLAAGSVAASAERSSTASVAAGSLWGASMLAQRQHPLPASILLLCHLEYRRHLFYGDGLDCGPHPTPVSSVSGASATGRPQQQHPRCHPVSAQQLPGFLEGRHRECGRFSFNNINNRHIQIDYQFVQRQFCFIGVNRLRCNLRFGFLGQIKRTTVSSRFAAGSSIWAGARSFASMLPTVQ